MNKPPRFANGFTLLEVLIALAIVAIGLSAALRASAVGSEAALEHRTRLAAMWLAQNVIAERTARGDWLEPGTYESEAELAGERFFLQEVVKPTPNPRFRRLEVSVRPMLAPDRQARTVVAFLVRTH